MFNLLYPVWPLSLYLVSLEYQNICYAHIRFYFDLFSHVFISLAQILDNMEIAVGASILPPYFTRISFYNLRFELINTAEKKLFCSR